MKKGFPLQENETVAEEKKCDFSASHF